MENKECAAKPNKIVAGLGHYYNCKVSHAY